MKETIEDIISLFTRFSTTIFLVDSIALLAFKGKQAKLLAIDVLCILGIALVCAIFYVLLLSDRNISKKKMFCLQLLYFVIIDTVTLTTGHLLHWISFCHWKTVAVFECVIIGVCAITILYSYRIDSNTAKKISEKLKILESEKEKN